MRVEDHRKEFIQLLGEIERAGYERAAVWADFLSILACAAQMLSNDHCLESRRKALLQTLDSYKPNEQAVIQSLVKLTCETIQRHPEQDFLGDIYSMDIGGKGSDNEFTPYNMAKLLVSIDLPEIVRCVKENGYAIVYDCCCGTGVLSIAAANELRRAGIDYSNHVLFIGQDISSNRCNAYFSQLSLMDCAAAVVCSNVLSEPIIDLPENAWYSPTFYNEVWTGRWKWRYIGKVLQLGTQQADKILLLDKERQK